MNTSIINLKVFRFLLCFFVPAVLFCLNNAYSATPPAKLATNSISESFESGIPATFILSPTSSAIVKENAGTSYGPGISSPAVKPDLGIAYVAFKSSMLASGVIYSMTTSELDLSGYAAGELSFYGYFIDKTFNGSLNDASASVSLIIEESANGTDFTAVGEEIESFNSTQWDQYKCTLSNTTKYVRISIKANASSFSPFFLDGLSISEKIATEPQGVSSIDEKFEGASIPNTWTTSATEGDIAWNVMNTTGNGQVYPTVASGYYATVPFIGSATGKAVLTTPMLALDAAAKLEFKYYVEATESTVSTTINVYTSTDGATYTQLGSAYQGTGQWVNISADLSADVKYVRFEGVFTQRNRNYYPCIDDVKIYTPKDELTNINEGFETLCPPAGWTTGAEGGSVSWKLDNDGVANGAPESKYGSRYATFFITGGANTLANLTTDKLSLGEKAILEFAYQIPSNCFGTTLKIQTSLDGITFTDKASYGASDGTGEWKDVKLNIDASVKHIRFVGSFEEGNRPLGVCLDEVKIYTPKQSETVKIIDESFETGEIPATWDITASSGAALTIFDATGRVQPNSMPADGGTKGVIYNSAWANRGVSITVITPELDLSENANNIVSFWYWNNGTNKDAAFPYMTVYHSVDGVQWNKIDGQNPENSFTLRITTSGKWEQFVTNIPSTSKYVKFEMNNTGSTTSQPTSNSVFDMFYIGKALCYPPKNMKVVETGIASAKLQWEKFGGELMYKMAYAKTNEFADGSYTNMVVADQSGITTKEITSLDANTTYYVSVKSNCSDADGVKAATISLKTLPLCPSPSEITTTDVTARGVKVSWKERGSATSWIVAHSQGQSVNWASASKIGSSDNTEFEIALSPADVTHAIEIKSVCGTNAGDTSEQSTAVTVKLPPTCPTPRNIIISDTTTEGFKLSWTAGGTETAWKVGVKTTLSGAYTEYNAAANNYVFTGLNDGSVYYSSVKAVCAENDNSRWLEDVKVMTFCKTLTEADLPWKEDMENADITGGAINNCMSATSSSSFGVFRGKTPSQGGMAHSGEKYIEVWHTNVTSGTAVTANDYLFMPEVSLVAGHVYEFSYFARISAQYVSLYKGNVMSVMPVISTLTTGLDTVRLSNTYKSFTILDTTYTAYKWEYTPAENGTYYFGIHALSSKTYADEYVTVDDFGIRRITNCAAVENLATEEVKHTSIKTKWESEATEFELRYGPASAASTTYTVVNVKDKIYNIAALLPATEYNISVRTICEIGDTSSWSDPINITTELACPAPKSLVVSDNTAEGFTVSFTEGRDETSWQISNAKGVVYHTANTDGVFLTDKSKSFTGLKHSSYYSIAVRAICGAEKSEWMKIQTTTSCSPFGVPYLNDFEEIVVPVLPPCVTAKQGSFAKSQSNNEDLLPANAHSGKGMLTNVAPNGDFIWMPEFALQSGRSYDISVFVESGDTTDIVRIVTKEADQISGISEAKIKNKWTYQAASGRYQAMANGNVTFGVYVRSSALFAIDDFSVKMHCSEPVNLATANITTSGADLSWVADANSYKVEYCKVNAQEYTSVDVTSETCTLTNLEPATIYQWRVKSICSENESDFVQAPSTFATKDVVVECDAPTALQTTGITQETVTFKWKGTSASYEVRLRAVGTEKYREETSVKDSLKLDALKSSTQYEWAVRAVCGETSKSEWTEGTVFTTQKAACQKPEGLSAELNPAEKSFVFRWFSDVTKHVVRYKLDAETAYTQVSVDSKTYTVLNAQEGVYRLYVRSVCAEGDSSEWANTNLEVIYSANEKLQQAGIMVYTTQGKIIVKSIAGLELKNIEVLDNRGMTVCKKNVNGMEAEMDCDFSSGAYLLRINTAHKTFMVKTGLFKK